MTFRTTIIILALSLGILSFAKGQQTTFQITYDGNTWPFITSALQSADGGYVFCGGTYTVFLIKTDSIGDTLWVRTYLDSSSYDSRARDVIQTTDMGYIICGNTKLKNNGSNYIYRLIKTDSIGNVIWSKSYNGTNQHSCYSIEQTTDGGYIVLGVKTFTPAVTYQDIYLLKTDSAGTVLWSRTYDGNTMDYGFSVKQTTDGGYILSGKREISGLNYKIYIIKIDSLGTVVWSKTIDGLGDGGSYSIRQNNSGGYNVVGYSWFSDDDMILISLDSLGNDKWHKVYGGPGTDIAYSFDFTSDGGYILAGYTVGYYGNEEFKGLLVKADSTGNVEWSRIYHGVNDYARIYSVHQTFDGGYILTGTTLDAQGYSDYFLIKTDSLGNMGCNDSSVIINAAIPTITVNSFNTSVNTINPTVNSRPILVGNNLMFHSHCMSTGLITNDYRQTRLMISPNPVSDELKISGYSLVNGKSEISIYNTLGVLVFLQVSKEQNFKIETSSLKAGIYYVIASGVHGKFIKE